MSEDKCCCGGEIQEQTVSDVHYGDKGDYSLEIEIVFCDECGDIVEIFTRR